MTTRDRLISDLHEQLGLEIALLDSLIETPPSGDMGDFALPCFRFAKELRLAPPKIAADFASRLSTLPSYIDRVEVAGPYLNFYLKRATFAVDQLASYSPNSPIPGLNNVGAGRRVLIEYSSPNIAKPFHIGHGFSTFLGHSLANIYEALGYDVLRLNHLGDYGTQFGKLITAWKLWGDEEALKVSPITELQRVYVLFHKELETRPELESEGRENFRLLESGDPEALALWQRFRDFSLLEFERLYQRMNIRFDNYNGESFYSDRIPAVVDHLRDSGLMEESEGAQVVRLDEFDLNPCIILKSDGTTIYASRDLAAIYYRDLTWDFFRNVYVVGNEQSNHFKQVFSVLKKADFVKADQCVHVAFGKVRFADGNFSSRKGNVILLEDLLNEAVAKTKEIISRNNSTMTPEAVEESAEIIGVGSVAYTYLRNGREKDIVFSWDEMLDFEGDSAAYLLYSYSRARSILRKAEDNGFVLAPAQKVRAELLVHDEEFNLLKMMELIPQVLVEAAEVYEPSIMLRHLAKMARAFNKYYHEVKILQNEDAELIQARLGLIEAFASCFKEALRIAGLRVVERM